MSIRSDLPPPNLGQRFLTGAKAIKSQAFSMASGIFRAVWHRIKDTIDERKFNRSSITAVTTYEAAQEVFRAQGGGTVPGPSESETLEGAKKYLRD